MTASLIFMTRPSSSSRRRMTAMSVNINSTVLTYITVIPCVFFISTSCGCRIGFMFSSTTNVTVDTLFDVFVRVISCF